MTCAQILKRPDFANMGETVAWEIAHRQVQYELPITLPEAAWDALPDALSEVNYMVQMAQGTLDHLSAVISQSSSADPGVIAMLELASRGLKHVSDHEGALLHDVETVLRAAGSRMMQEKASNQAKGKR